ncbi:MAG: hypothetical protein EB824_03300 [Thaumarchaeota archaeon S15]|nr:MAG: hypothetical protein EB824_03300 [Thaumarchaeota archaeon S15]
MARRGRAARMKIADAIEVILKKHGAMSCADIADQIQKNRMAKLGGKTPAATVGSAMIKDPDRFVWISKGVYDVKNSSAQITPQPFIKYHYTEQSVGVDDSGYYHIELDGIGEMFVGEKLVLTKALSSKFSGSRKNFPSVYVLGINVQQKEAYVGESYETLVRINHWKNNKKYKYAAIFHTDKLQNDNIRRNVEHVLIEWFKSTGWKLQNQNSNPRDIMPRDMYSYERIKEMIPIVGYKIKCVFEMCDSVDSHVRMPGNGKEPKPQPRGPRKWTDSLKQADTPTRELASEIINGIQSNVGGVMFETAWLYFGDGAASRKKAFVALDVGKRWLDLVFLAPEGTPLPKTARRLKPFVLSQKSECRLRLDRTNLKDAIEIAAKSRDYMRSLDKKTPTF